MTAVAVRRLAYGAVGALAPGVRARWATDAFSYTRTFAGHPDDVLPLGARPFAVEGCDRVQRGYLWGDGEPVALLVHGWGSDSCSMVPLVEPLAQAGFAVAAFDAPGHGVSPGDDATMTEYVEAVGAVLAALPPTTVIVAHSVGAIAAVGALQKHDPGIERIVLIAPACTLSGVLDRWSPADIGVSPPLREKIYAELHRRNGVPVSHWNVTVLGAGLRCPVVAIHDPHDPLVPFSETEAIAAGLADVRVMPAPGRGHASVLGAPEGKEAVAADVAEPQRSDPATAA